MTFRIPSYVPEGLLLFAVVFGPLAFGAIEPWSKAILEIDLFLLFAACVLRGKALPANPVYTTLLPASLLLLSLGAIQYLNPRFPLDPASLFPSTVSARATGRELLLWMCYACLLWSAPHVLASRAAAWRFSWTVFLLGVFIAVVGIIQRAQGNTAYYGLRTVRWGLPFGPYANRDHAASMMVMSALTGFGLLCSRQVGLRELRRTELTDLLASQAAALFLLTVLLFGIFSTYSRGAVNSLFVASWITSLLATAFIKKRWERCGLRAAAALVLVSYFAFLWFNPLWIGYILKTPDLSTAYRFSMYRSALILFRDLPLWGAGLGALERIFPAYQEQFVTGLVEHVHGDWLEFICELGLVGSIIALIGLVSFFRANLRVWWFNPSHHDRYLSSGACAALIAFLLHETVDFNFHIPANAVIFLTLACFFGSSGHCARLHNDLPRDENADAAWPHQRHFRHDSEKQTSWRLMDWRLAEFGARYFQVRFARPRRQ